MAKFKPAKQQDLDLMPIMNLLCLLIPFLLLSAQFIQIGIILVDTPKKSRSKKKNDDVKKKTLGLTIDITTEGYYISSKKGSACPNKSGNGQPCLAVTHAGGKKIYPSVLLRKFIYTKFYKPNHKTNSLGKKKGKENTNVFADWGKVTIRPQDQIKYDTIIKTLDASRELPPEAKTEIDEARTGSLACVFKKKRGEKDWALSGHCMFPLVSLGNR
jgi:Biopolymer transport protein ExbD/TolR